MSLDVDVHLSTASGPRLVGRLLDADRQIHFQYDRAFLGSGLELSPFKLPLQPGRFAEGPPDLSDDEEDPEAARRSHPRLRAVKAAAPRLRSG